MKDIGRVAFLFVFGFMAYITVEVLYRGHSYPLMGALGGAAVVFPDLISRKSAYGADIILTSALNAAAITALELGIGLLSLNGLLPVMWDYSALPLNYRGMICLPFTAAWFLLSVAACIITDLMNYYFFGDDGAPRYRLFGKVILKPRNGQTGE